MSRMKISPADRLTVLGKTGSGKTTNARHLLWLAALAWERARDTRSQIFILATKFPRKPDFVAADFPGTSFSKIIGLKRVLEPRARIVVVYPTESELLAATSNSDFYDEFFYRVFKRSSGKNGRPGIVYVDELTNVTGGQVNGGPQYFQLAYTQGRALDLGAWSGQQDASFIDRRVLSQAEHFLVGPLRMETDQKKMQTVMGLPKGSVKEEYEDAHGFWYVGPGNKAYFRSIQEATGVALAKKR